MQLREQQILPPSSNEVFESLCRALFAAHWQDPLANARLLQAKFGVDVYGKTSDGAHWGVRCWSQEKLTTQKMAAVTAKTAQFQPRLNYLIIATASAADAKLQQYARQLSEEQAKHGACAVHVYSWESLVDLLDQYPIVARRFYPELFSSRKKPLHLPPQQLSPWFSDPRDDLTALRTLLQSALDSRVVLRTAVQGMGGVGKTQLALKYSLTFQDDYAGVWWFNSANSESLLQDCLLFCALQGIALPETKDLASVAPAAMRAWLARQQNWLLVFDNAETDTHLQNYLPQVGGHHLLLTSRHPNWQGMQELALGVWSENQALPYLQLRLPHQQEAHLRALSLALDGLPLALEQACAYILKHQVDVLAYVQRVEDVQKQIALMERNDVPVYGRVVLATLAIAFEELSEPARALLQLCGWLAPEPIPDFLFTEQPEILPFALQSLDDRIWRETVVELESHALCTWEGLRLQDHVGNGTEQAQCLQLHRMTQMAVRAKLDSGYQAALLALRAGFPAIPSERQAWPRCQFLQHHIQALHSWKIKDDCAPIAYLLSQLGIWLSTGPALYTPALQMQKQSVQIAHDVLGEEHPSSLIYMNNLAETLRKTGELAQACHLQEKTLEFQYRVRGEEHPTTLTVMNNLASIHREMGDLSTARRLQEKELAICLRILGEDHPATLCSMNNLALILKELGELSTARSMYENAHNVRKRVLGEEHLDTLNAKSNLASILWQMGESQAASDLQEKTLTIQCSLLGDEHPETLTSASNLALMLGQMGELAKSRDLQEKILEVRCRILGLDHPKTLTAMNNLASTYSQLGELSLARSFEEEVLGIRRRLLGEDHPDTLTSMNNLALTFADLGQMLDACNLHEKILSIRLRVFGEEHPASLNSMNNLASVFKAMGKLPAARDLHEKQLSISRRVLGETHPNTLTAMNNLASMFSQIGDLVAARGMYENALAGFRIAWGEDHPDTLTAMNNFASILSQMGDLPAARSLEEQVLNSRRRQLGEEHPDTLISINNLATTLWEMGELSSARDLEEQVLEIRSRVLGMEHPSTLIAMNNLAATLMQLGQVQGARDFFEKSLEISNRVFGEEHIETVKTMSNLAATLWQLDQLHSACSLQEKALRIQIHLLGENHPNTKTFARNLAAMQAGLKQAAAMATCQLGTTS